VPAVTPVGYAAEKRRLADNLMRQAIGADNRKPVEGVYFESDFDNPAKPQEVLKEIMNCVRIAPSASNKQPWRIVSTIRDSKSGIRDYNFYLERDKNYIYPAGQNIDMGIAMCHFEYACAELGVKGNWMIKKPEVDDGGREYVVSWIVM
jgi:hypothetical protein